MPWEGEDRRKRITGDTGQRRREDDWNAVLRELGSFDQRVESVENRLSLLDGVDGKPGLLAVVAEMAGEVKTLKDICLRIDGKTGFNWTTFLATVIVPLAGLILTAYLAIRIGAPQALPGGSP